MKGFFADALKHLQILYTEKQIDTLIAFYNELSVWNKKCGFVKAEGKELAIKHFFDSLSGVPLLEKISFKTAADVGTGAGFPGIPLSIFFPDKSFALIERSSKKCAFLENCKALLSLENTEVLNKEIEDVKTYYDVVTFRAFRQFDEYAALLLKRVCQGGILFAYKGKYSEVSEDIKKSNLKPQQCRTEKVFVPFLAKGEERHILICQNQD